MTGHRQRAFSSIELIVALVLTLILSVAAIQYFIGAFATHDRVDTENFTIATGRTPIDTLVDHLRNAQENSADGNAAIVAGSATSVEYYTGSGNDSVRYSWDGSNLLRTDSGGTTVVVRNVTAFNLTYFLASRYNVVTLSVPASVGALSAAERLQVAAVQVSATVGTGGSSKTFSSTVRLRNSPRKIGL